MVKLALFHSFDEKVLPQLCFVLITERQVEHQALCFYFVTPCCSSCNSQQGRLLYSLKFVFVQSLSFHTPNFLIRHCSYCILVLIHGIFLFSNQLYHCIVLFFSLQAKQRVDVLHLQLQNLLYEVMHLQKEISKCLEFKLVQNISFN